MKQKVKFSNYCLIMTAVIAAVFIAGIFSLLGDTHRLTMFCLIFGAVTAAGLYYCPVAVEADQSGIKIHRLLSGHKFFDYRSVQSVETFYPSAGGLRLCGSGGYFGYWGYFNDIMAGTYFGYYASRDNCFLVRLKNGKQYIIGCEDSHAMTEYVRSHMA